MLSNKRYLLLFFIHLSLLQMSKNLFAGQENIASLVSGETIWSVHTSDQEHMTKVYTRDINGHLNRLVLSGNLLSSKTSAGIHQLDHDGSTPLRHEAWAIIDGKITFFHSYSSPGNPASITSIDKDFPVLNLATNDHIQVPPITSYGHLTFSESSSKYLTENGKRIFYKDMLFSIKYPFSIYKKHDGVTFIIRIFDEKTEEKAPYKILARFIDDHFYSSSADLDRLLNQSKIIHKAQSQKIVDQLSSKEPFYRAIKKLQLESKSNPPVEITISEDLSSLEQPEDLKIEIQSLRDTHLRFFQVIPLDHSLPYVQISSSKDHHEKIPGFINGNSNLELELCQKYTSTQHSWEITHSPITASSSDKIIGLYINESLHLLHESDHLAVSTLKLDKGSCASSKPDEFTLRSLSHKNKQHILMVSCIQGENETTDIYRYSVHSNYIHLDKHLQLAKKYFDSYEFGNRIYTIDRDDICESYFNLYKEKESISKKNTLTLPQVDLNRSLDLNKISYKFIEKSNAVTPQQMRRVSYMNSVQTLPEFKDIAQQHTGLFLQNPGEPEYIYSAMQLDAPNDLEVGKGMQLRSNNFIDISPTETPSSKHRLSAWLMDTTFEDGKNEFSFVMSMQDLKNDYASIAEERFNFAISNLKGIYFRGESIDEIFKVILAYIPDPSDPEKLRIQTITYNPKSEQDDLFNGTHHEVKIRNSRFYDYKIPIGIKFQELDLDHMISEQFRKSANPKRESDYFIGQIIFKNEVDYIGFNPLSIQSAQQRPDHILSEKIFSLDGQTDHLSIQTIDPTFSNGHSRKPLIIAKLARHNQDIQVASFPVGNDVSVIKRIYLVPGDLSQTMGHLLVIAVEEYNRRTSRTEIIHRYHYFNPTNQNLENTTKNAPIYQYSADFKTLPGISSLTEPNEVYSRFLLSPSLGPVWIYNAEYQETRNTGIYDLNNGQTRWVEDISNEYIPYYTVDEIKIKKQTHSSWATGIPQQINSSSKPKKSGAELAKIWDMYPEILKRIESLTHLDKSPEHLVLIVNDEIKDKLIEGLNAIYAKQENGHAWSYQNKDLSLYQISSSDKISQTELHRNFTSIAKSAEQGKRPVVLSDVHILLDNNFPRRVGAAEPYLIEYNKSSVSPHNYGVNHQVKMTTHTEPSSLLIFATEGKHKALSYQDTVPAPVDCGILLISTKTDWTNLITKIPSFEKRMGLINHFNTIQLGAPDESTFMKMIVNEIDKFSAVMPHVKFDASSIHRNSHKLSENECKHKIAHYLFSKARGYATENGIDPTCAVTELLTNLSDMLSHQNESFEGHEFIFDRTLMEHVLQETFDLPLSPELLPESDPINQLKRPDIYLRWSEAEYDGNIDIKRKIVNGILAQTNSGYQKAIPGSFVIHGPNGTGKTLLFDSLINLLGLKKYRFDASEEENLEASVFKINLARVTENILTPQENSSNTMKVADVIKHFERFLKLPNGRRGFILFDDAHLCSDKVREPIFSLIRSLFDSDKGHYNGIPVRNLSIFMTFNPTEDPEKIGRVGGRHESGMRKVLATFSGTDNKVDASFFNRWNHVLELANFNGYGRTHELVRNLSKSSQTLLGDGAGLLLYSENAIHDFKERFPSANARDYLNLISSVIYEKHRDQGVNESLEILVRNKHMHEHQTKQSQNSSLDSDDVTDYIHQNFQSVPVRQSGIGFLSFMHLITNNFRQKIFSELLLRTFTRNIRYQDSTVMNGYLAPILEAGKGYLSFSPEINLSLMKLSQDNIENALLERGRIDWDKSIRNFTQTNSAIDYTSRVEKAIFATPSASSNIQLFESKYSFDPKAPLYKLFNQTKNQLVQLLKRRLAYQTHFDQICLPLNESNLNQWARVIGVKHENDTSISEILEIYERFENSFSDIEMKLASTGHQKWQPFATFDSFTLFSLLIDFSITKLEWPEIVASLAYGLDHIASDLGLANLPNVKGWLFEQSSSILQTKLRTDYQKIMDDVDTFNLSWSPKTRERNRKANREKIDQLSLWLEGKSSSKDEK